MSTIQEKFITLYEDRKDINKKFAIDLVEYYINKLKLENQINKIRFTNTEVTHFDMYDSIISLNFDDLLDYSKVVNDQDKCLQTYFNNARMVYYIIHEIMHAKQTKLLNNNDIIGKTINLSFTRIYEDSKKGGKIYHSKHDDFVVEHNANVEGYIEMLNFLNTFSSRYNFDVAPLIYYLRQSFTKTSCPIKREANLFKEKYVIPNMDNLTEYEKVIYGLPIENKTYQKTRKFYKDGVINYEKYFNRL